MDSDARDVAQAPEDPRDRRIAELEAQVLRLTERLNQALSKVEELERASHRQAAPFRREPRKVVPPEQRKKPGRKPGHEGSCRRAPDRVDRVIDVPLPGPVPGRCPRCGGELRGVRELEQIIEEVEPVRPVVVRLVTRRATCSCCGEPYAGTHPPQRSAACGAAKVQLGPRAVALATLLNKACGLTTRKTVAVMKHLCGLRLTPGGLTQAMARATARAADKCAGDYQELLEELLEELRRSDAVHADETGWWVGGPGHWLWGFTTPRLTLYRVGRRGSAMLREVLGESFGGVLVSDCLNSYDPYDCRKHKCFAHHHRAVASAAGLQEDQAYLRQWTLLLKAAAELWRLHPKLDPGTDPEKFERRRLELEAWKDRLLDGPVGLPGDVKVRNRLVKHRPHLLRCLEEPAAEPTNNRAERALRPAVICRKLSCGNKTERGRRTWEVLASLGVTCAQRGEDFVQWLAPRLALTPAAR